tara:strand:- start:316 stop:915 length:600 start_codon:yes stop_codon:yes gene_type:complete
MKRKLELKNIVIASHNIGKIKEINDLLKPFSIKTISAKDLLLDEPIENGKTFEENSFIKASTISKFSNRPALSDDSGLVIPSLGGKPGIYSARWAGKNKNFNLAMKKIHKLIYKKDTFCWFVCCLTIVWPDGNYKSFSGRVYGNIVNPAIGTFGFGYDPIFKPLGYKLTFGEMNPKLKHKISHRAKAFSLLKNELLNIK